MDAFGAVENPVVAILGLLAAWACLIGLGLLLRLFLKRRPLGELALWCYLVMGMAATHPHHLHRMTLNTVNFPGPVHSARYLLAVIPDFVIMSLTWPLLEYLLLFSPYVGPDARGRVQGEALTALLVTCILGPSLTVSLRRVDRWRSARRVQRDTA